MLDLVVPLRCKSYAEVDEVDEDGAAAQSGIGSSSCRFEGPLMDGCWDLLFLGWLRSHDRSISAKARSTCHATSEEKHRVDSARMRRMLRCCGGEISSREVEPDT